MKNNRDAWLEALTAVPNYERKDVALARIEAIERERNDDGERVINALQFVCTHVETGLDVSFTVRIPDTMTAAMAASLHALNETILYGT